MKKFLSLVLALVMTMSLVTISAGATEFTDGSKIAYDEATSVIAAAGIVGGYADGSFNPQNTLTRGAAAKIICNLILGPTAADALGVSAAPFKDVPASHTFAGYIAYCSSQKIINGYSDGTFRPAGTVNGFAFMKMLLAALGYDGAIEGFTGSNWTVNVAKLASKTKLSSGNDSFVGTKALTREEACLYSLNTLKAFMVGYATKGTNITTSDGTIINVGAAPALSTGNTFMSTYFSRLKTTATSDDFQNTATRWTNNGKEIGVYANAPEMNYTESVKAKDLYSDLGLTSPVTATVYRDGVMQANFSVNNTGAPADLKVGGKGVVANVHVTRNPATDLITSVKIVLIESHIGTISDSDKDSKGNRTVSLDTETVTYKTTEFAVDNVVLYTFANGNIQSMVLAESVSGVLSSRTGTSKFVIDGTSYDTNADINDKADYAIKDEVTAYLDANGNIVQIGLMKSADTVANYAFVRRAGTAGGFLGQSQAELVYSDGTVAVVATDKDYNTIPNNFVGRVVSHKENKDGKIALTSRSTANLTAKNVTFETGKNKIANITDSTNIFTNNQTVFLIATDKSAGAGTDMSYKAYVGYAAAPSINGVVNKIVSYAKAGSSIASLVYVEANSGITGSNAKMTFVIGNTSADLMEDASGTYYSYKAVVEGKMTTLKVDPTQAVSNGVAAFSTVSYNTDDIATVLTPGTLDTNFFTTTTTGAESSGVVNLGGTVFNYSSDVAVFFTDADKNLSEGKIGSIKTDDNSVTKNAYSNVFYTLNSNGEVNVIVLVKN